MYLTMLRIQQQIEDILLFKSNFSPEIEVYAITVLHLRPRLKLLKSAFRSASHINVTWSYFRIYHVVQSI